MICLGPILNFVVASLYASPSNISVLMAARTLKLMVTTFSGTVMSLTAFMDVLKGPQLASALACLAR